MRYLSSLLALAALPLLAHANPVELNQHWEGKGVLISTGAPQPLPVSMAVHLEITADSLKIEDCWKNAEQHIDQCYSSLYDLDKTQSIYDKGKKIGDIYPGHIVVFTGKSQVSEQMVFDIRGTGQLNLQYNFAAFDGVYSVRQGLLDPVN